MRPIINIIESNNSELFNETYYPLFGKYKGLKGGHKFLNCTFIFPNTCAWARNKYNYQVCPNDGKNVPLNWDTCEEFTIPEINYTYYTLYNENKYLYSEKANNNLNYEIISKMNSSDNGKCPEGKKKCGFLYKGSMLCFNIEDECPINDIIFNENKEYVDNNITYKTIKINENEYIHYTNEKTNNQIIFDLILSIEHPLSKIEIPRKEYLKNIFKLSTYEYENYYKGNINNIKSFKQIYNTNITYKQLIEMYNIYDMIASQFNYKFEYLSSKMFIYKKYAIPIKGVTYQEIEKFNKDYFISYVLNYFSASFLIFNYGIPILILKDIYYWILLYLGSTLVDIIICLFFFLKFKCLTNTIIFKDSDILKEKNYNRFQLLSIHVSYTIIVIILNLIFIFLKFKEKREEREKNEKNSYLI